MKASDLFVKALENEGVEYIFGIPGEENLDLLESLRTSKIKFIITRHEQAAGFMAATYGRLTGRVGVCLSTLGPGATNLVTAAAYAQLCGFPMLMITGQKPIKKSKQGRFQVIDIVSMLRPITKYTTQIVNANNIAPSVREAFKCATMERPGAVHIELPEDIAREEVEHKLYPVINSVFARATDSVIYSAVKMIESAKRPLLLIGAGANRTDASKELTRFVQKTGIPFFTTQMGKGVINEDSEICLRTAALSSDDFIHCAIERADLIINVGYDAVEKPAFLMNKNDAKVIHINFYPSHINEVYYPQLDVLGEIKTNIQNITSNIEVQSHWDFDYYKRVAKEIKTRLHKYFGDDRFPILPQRVVRIIRDALKPSDILTLDNGMYKIWFARNYSCSEPNTLLLDNNLATMGAGLPSAIAAKLINPDKKVVSVCGDGGFMMNSQELETAVRLGVDIVVIILNDSAFGMIKWKQEGMGFDNFALDYNNPDFVMYAKSYGANGYRPNSCEEFKETLNECLGKKGVHLIDLRVDYSLNHHILHEVLKNKSCLI
ncbi:MAG: acetolactate synthase large subunit [Campylobacter sp.]|nr:acetolactate synthase large subunit [Campylobacter sp.]